MPLLKVPTGWVSFSDVKAVIWEGRTAPTGPITLAALFAAANSRMNKTPPFNLRAFAGYEHYIKLSFGLQTYNVGTASNAVTFDLGLISYENPNEIKKSFDVSVKQENLTTGAAATYLNLPVVNDAPGATVFVSLPRAAVNHVYRFTVVAGEYNVSESAFIEVTATALPANPSVSIHQLGDTTANGTTASYSVKITLDATKSFDVTAITNKGNITVPAGQLTGSANYTAPQQISGTTYVRHSITSSPDYSIGTPYVDIPIPQKGTVVLQ